MIPLTEILTAHRRIRPFIYQTPLLYSPSLSQKTGGEVWLKLENQQPTGSFKVRGALNRLQQLTAAEKAHGIVTASAGNHALGVAHAVKALGTSLEAHLFVPQPAPASKIAKLRRYPVTLHLAGQTYDEAHELAEEFRIANNLTQIPAYDHKQVITGQATIAVEILIDLPTVTDIVVPIGGGGMIAGIQTAVSQLSPTCRIIGIQPEASPAAQLSFQEGTAHETYDHQPTIADGLAGGFGQLPFELLNASAPPVLLASEHAIRHAIYWLLREHQLIAEPSAAISLVPLLEGSLDLAGKTAVCIICGGNLDTRLLRDILNEFAHE